MTLEEMVEVNYASLNENDLYIWQYIYHHKQQCLKMTIKDLAKACNVSHTSILRFTKKLGLDGYSEFKVYLKMTLEKKSNFDSKTVDNTVQELSQTMKMLQEKDLDGILQKIDEAKRVFIYGTGEVQYNASMEFKREFVYRKKIMHVIEGKREVDATLHVANKGDVFIIISLSGDNETAVMLAKALKQMKIATIGIALQNNNLLSKYCDEFIGFNCTPFYTGYANTQYSCSGHFFLISNILFVKYLEYKDLQERS